MIEKTSGTVSHATDTGKQNLCVYSSGVVKIGRTLFFVTQRMGGRIVMATSDRDGVVFANTELTAE
ncbi:hypothetical protein AAGW05_14330 [Arthrobacter sp. LAPM80]|uniref:hypothetical protein n=1 Tax=Arthrobacter sp. LAPM80 TaxID=3141788 RepID=UPI00398B6A56